MELRARIVSLAIVLLTIIAVSPGGRADAADPIVLQSAGCKTEYFLLRELAAAYGEKSGGKVQLGSTGNKKAVELLKDNKVDFAFTCKSISQLTKGLKLDPAAVSGWKSIAIAKDPVVVVANQQAGITGLSTEQLTSLFQGKTANWKQVGGSDLPVKTAYMNPELESGLNLLFKEFTVGEEGTLDPSARIGDNPSMLGNYVSMTPGAVTFMGFNSYQEKYGPILAIDGVAPTRDNILNGSYKLAATYYLTLTGGTKPDVDAFVRFVQSEEGRAVIARNFIPFAETK